MTVQITGQSATGSVGEPSTISKANITPTGVEGTGLEVLIWSLIDDTQTKNYANINTDQSSSFAENNETQTPNWEEVAQIMATYVNDLRLKEIATGDESGTWEQVQTQIRVNSKHL